MKPAREHATNNSQTYMITSSTWGRRSLFRNERWAKLLIDTLYHYRGTAYLLHEFVVMPDHIHVLITPLTSLEKAVQFIKGGFSYRAKKELGSNMEVWQKGFSDHRIRDANDYGIHVSYIHQNPVKERFCGQAADFPYSSARAGFEMDEVPQGLKPESLGDPLTARLESVPLQSKIRGGETQGEPQNKTEDESVKIEAFQSKAENATAAAEVDKAPQGLKPEPLGAPLTARLEGVPFQSKISNQSGIENESAEIEPLQDKIENAAANAEPIDIKSKTA